VSGLTPGVGIARIMKSSREDKIIITPTILRVRAVNGEKTALLFMGYADEECDEPLLTLLGDPP
jgi:hypothetical protein